MDIGEEEEEAVSEASRRACNCAHVAMKSSWLAHTTRPRGAEAGKVKVLFGAVVDEEDEDVVEDVVDEEDANASVNCWAMVWKWLRSLLCSGLVGSKVRV